MEKKITICIAGKNDIALFGVDYCLKNHSDKELVFLPNKSDNGINNWQKSFKKFCLNKNIRQVEIRELYKLKKLIFISLEYENIIDTEKFKTNNLFNIHFSLLPKYKGMYTSALPLIYGEKYSGVTLHKIDNGIDTGDIISQIKFKIDKNDNARKLYFKYLYYSKKLFKKNIDYVIDGNYKSFKQQHENSSYYSKSVIDYKNININLNKTAFEIHNQFRGYTFREYQVPMFSGWGIFDTNITDIKSNLRPGSIVNEDNKKFIISTIDYNLILYKDYYPLLWKSAKNNDLKNLKKAINYIEDLNVRDKKGWTGIAIAAYYEAYESLQMLLDNGALANCGDFDNITPIMRLEKIGINESSSKIYKLLLENI